MDEDKLAELIESIRMVGGLIEPLVVRPEGEMFRVLAGHRRLIACRALDYKTLPCMVRDGELSGAAITTHENQYREDLNAGEEAKYFARLLDAECQGDVDKLCELVKNKRAYVEDRLVLLRGDLEILDALCARAITMGVADELNKVKHAARRKMYLEAAMQGGATIRMVRDWRVRGNAMDDLQAEPPIIDPNRGVSKDIVQPIMTMECFLCHSPEDAWDLELLYVHRACRRVLIRREAAGGEILAPPAEGAQHGH